MAKHRIERQEKGPAVRGLCSLLPFMVRRRAPNCASNSLFPFAHSLAHGDQYPQIYPQRFAWRLRHGEVMVASKITHQLSMRLLMPVGSNTSVSPWLSRRLPRGPVLLPLTPPLKA
ncbi:MAG: hypothetical protein K0R58_2908 [Ramlibacter sp.]|nr:hypothetical protein [Ramlibacter sp.]